MPGAQANYQPPPAPEGGETVRPRRAIGGYVLKAALGAGILAFVLSRLDLHHLWQILRRERLSYFLAATAIYVCGQLIASYRWKLLARMVGIVGGYVEFVLYFLIGAFTNLFVPGLIGGDAARALYLGRRRHEIGKAVASVLADRGFGLLALIWLSTICVALLSRGIFPHSVTTPVFLTGAITAIMYLAMPAFLVLNRRLPRRLAATVSLLAPYLDGRVALIPALALSLVLHLMQVFAQYVLALGLGLNIPARLFLLCVPTTNVLAAIPITFNGLGVREGLYVVLFGMAGVPKADAVALGLLWFAITTFAGLCASAAFIAVPAPIEGQAPEDASNPRAQTLL